MANTTHTLSPAAGRQLIVGCSPAGRITLWSADVAEFLGIPEDHAVGRTPQSVANWEATARDRTACSLLGLGSVWVFTCAVTTKTGQRFTLSTTATVALDPGGRAETLYRSTIIPGGAILASPRRRLPAWGGVQELVAFCDDVGRYTYVSQRILNVFGYAPRDIIGRRSTEFLHPDDQAQFTRAWDSAVADPAQPQRVTIRRSRRDGTWVTLNTLIRNEFHNPAIAAMVLRGREKAPTSVPPVDSTRRTLDAFLRNTSDGVWVLDAAGHTTYSNQRMHDLLDGTNPAGNATAVNATAVNGGEDSAGEDSSGEGTGVLLRHLRSLLERRLDREKQGDDLAGGGPGIQETHDVPVDGADGRRWIRLSIASRYDDAGHVVGRMILATDVTAQRHAVVSPSQFLVGPASGAGSATSSFTATRDLFPISATAAAQRLDGLPVTARERLIVADLLNGDRVPAIARRHSVSQSTVRNQLASVFQKLRVGSQQELIDYLRSTEPRR